MEGYQINPIYNKKYPDGSPFKREPNLKTKLNLYSPQKQSPMLNH